MKPRGLDMGNYFLLIACCRAISDLHATDPEECIKRGAEVNELLRIYRDEGGDFPSAKIAEIAQL
jgi:hypothetical protein